MYEYLSKRQKNLCRQDYLGAVVELPAKSPGFSYGQRKQSPLGSLFSLQRPAVECTFLLHFPFAPTPIASSSSSSQITVARAAVFKLGSFLVGFSSLRSYGSTILLSSSHCRTRGCFQITVFTCRFLFSACASGRRGLHCRAPRSQSNSKVPGSNPKQPRYLHQPNRRLLHYRHFTCEDGEECEWESESAKDWTAWSYTIP